MRYFLRYVLKGVVIEKEFSRAFDRTVAIRRLGMQGVKACDVCSFDR